MADERKDPDPRGQEPPEARDTESPSHQRPPYSDPLPGGIDPTAPGAPHEAGGEAMRQSEIENPATHRADTPDSEVHKSHLGKYPQ